jgi:hypothetical protein
MLRRPPGLASRVPAPSGLKKTLPTHWLAASFEYIGPPAAPEVKLGATN